MSNESSEKIIRLVVDKLVSEYAPQKVILFGSHAHGTAGRDSDIDLLIVKETEAAFVDRCLAAREAIGKLSSSIPMDLLVMTPAEVKARLAKGDQFVEDIVSGGRWLYGEAEWQRFGAGMTESNPSYAMEWLTNSERDLRRSRLLLSDNDASGAGFHLEQSLEKALKAFLLYNGWRLQRTHELETLLEAALAFDAGIENMRHLCRRVSVYYMADRYPDSGRAVPSEAEVSENLAVAEQFVARVRQAIGS